MSHFNFKLPVILEEESIPSVKAMLIDQRPQIEKDFITFTLYSKKLLDVVGQHVKTTIDADLGTIPDMISECSSLSYSLGQAVADSKVYQQIYKTLHHTEKRSSMSEADRKLLTETMTLRQSWIANSLAMALDKVDKRITVLQSLLKTETAKLSIGALSGQDISNT